MRISTHQSRVLAALLELELAHEWRWWSRYTIGHVVAAGGYHETLQMATVAALKAGGMIQTERSSWPAEVQRLVRCSCGCGEWGLTNRGRTTAHSLRIVWDEASRKRILSARWCSDHGDADDLVDEDDRRAELRRQIEERRREAEDDDDDRDPADFWKS